MQGFLFLTAPGLEDMVKSEILDFLRKESTSTENIQSGSGRGWVFVTSVPGIVPEELSRAVTCSFRTIGVKGSAKRGGSPAEIEAAALAERSGFPELKKHPSFRITCFPGSEPSGTARLVEQSVGANAVNSTGAPVSLKKYSINYGVEFIDQRIFFGTVLKNEEDTPRYRKQFQVRTSVRAHIAAAMLRLCGYTGQPGVLLDPCCGSGTILLEAASVHPGIRLYGVDIDPKCVEGSQRNLKALAKAGAKAGDGSRTYQGDARKLTEMFPAGNIAFLVSNLPFGIRTGKKINFYSFYRDLLKGADRVLMQKGRAALLIGRNRGILERAVEDDNKFKIIHRRAIEVAGLHPAVYILQKKEP